MLITLKVFIVFIIYNTDIIPPNEFKVNAFIYMLSGTTYTKNVIVKLNSLDKYFFYDIIYLTIGI